MVEKKEFMEIGMDDPESTRFIRAPWISGASMMSQLSSGASRVQAASAKAVDVGVHSSSNTNWPHSFSGRHLPA